MRHAPRLRPEFVNVYTLDRVVEETRLSAESVEQLARTIHDGKRVSFWWTMGVNQSHQADVVEPRRLAQDSRFNSWGSGHPGGVNFVFCDGAARFISDTISQITLSRLSTRDGAEVASEFGE